MRKVVLAENVPAANSAVNGTSISRLPPRAGEPPLVTGAPENLAESTGLSVEVAICMRRNDEVALLVQSHDQ